MTKQTKIKLIKKLYKEGKIKKLGNNTFTTPGEVFALGITPRLIHETISKCISDSMQI